MRAAALLLSLSLFSAACSGEREPAPPPLEAAAAPAVAPAAPALKASTPEPGVALEPVELVIQGRSYRFQAEIADNEAERAQGLMNRPSLPEDRAMLFLFPDEAPRGFWMKNTQIPLDILYLNRRGEIVSIVRGAVPLSEATVPSGAPAAAVLEINGGLADRLGVAPGDVVRHPALSPQ